MRWRLGFWWRAVVLWSESAVVERWCGDGCSGDSGDMV
ncbi:hypothetical protein A2U01_0100575, partial [Trifolium medium]|nr:hypothetical protein [Trifolium medium]